MSPYSHNRHENANVLGIGLILGYVLDMTIKSSQNAIDLIVAEEDSSAAYYAKHYTHMEWPAGASGPTVGIGYDLGYVTVAEMRLDWAGIVTDAMIEGMVPACGLKGEVAHRFVQAHGGGVTITWDQAMTEFITRELPKWEFRVESALPNTELLSGDSFGALVSLSYNRGTGGFHDPSPRDVEMRAIVAHMAAKQFNLIPMEFLRMRRLWPKGGDLWNRRGHEAALFVSGLTP